MRVVGPCESGTEGARAQARAASRQDRACPGAVTVCPATVMVESVDDAEGLYVAVERCPLCNTARRRLTCARCIKAGDFVYFDGKNPERYVLSVTKHPDNKPETSAILLFGSENPNRKMTHVASILTGLLCKHCVLLAHANNRAKQHNPFITHSTTAALVSHSVW